MKYWNSDASECKWLGLLDDSKQ